MSRRNFTVRAAPQGEYAGFFADIKRAIESLGGDFVGRSELVSAKLIALRAGIVIPGEAAGGETAEEVVYTTPPAPTNVAATALYSAIMIEFDPATYVGHARAEILRSTTNDPGSALVVGQTPQSPYVDTVGAGSPTYYYWVRFVNGAGDPGSLNSQVGVTAKTAFDPSPVIEGLSDTGGPLVVLDAPLEIDGFTYPVGVYASQSFLLDAQITRAKIKDLAVDDAKIASVSVEKLTTGSIAVGQYAQSTGYVPGSAGWRINGDGTAEFSGVVVRGTIYASAGQIGGSTIGSTYMRSTTYVLGTSGWNFNADGTGQIGGVAILNDRIQSNNYVAGSAGWRISQDGTAEFSNGTIRASGVELGADVGPGAGHYGLSLSPDNYNDIFIKRSDGVRFFRVNSGGTNYIDFSSENGNLNIKSAGFQVIGGVMTISQANVINTLNIAGNAVSVPVGSYTAGSVALGVNELVASLTMQTIGQPVFIAVSCRITSDNGAEQTLQLGVKRNGNSIMEIDSPVFTLGTPCLMNYTFIDSPGSGTTTYEVRRNSSSGAGNKYASRRSLVCMELRR